MPTQMTEVRSGSVELGITTEEPSNVETEESRAVLEPALDTPFEIASPPRSRGRPKRSAKAKKAARNLAVTAASDDSDLYASNLSLASVQEVISAEPTYDSAAELLSKFKVFEYGVKFRAPTARKMSNLPPSKPVIQLESITRILRPEHIKMCYAKVSALQTKSRGLPESDVVLDIIGFGVYSTEALRIMNSWHTAMKAIKLLDKGIRWIDTIDFAKPMPASFQRNADSELLSRMKSLPLLSTKTDILELVGRNQLSDTTITIVMGKLFGARSDVVTVNPAVIGMITSHSTTRLTGLEDIFVGLTTEKILIPICCNNQHWCSIMMDLTLKDVCFYDPMSSSYMVGVRAVAEKLVKALPNFAPRKYRVRPYQSDMGVQADSYNCGMYILLAFEVFAGTGNLSLLNRKELQYLRYRYLCMCT